AEVETAGGGAQFLQEQGLTLAPPAGHDAEHGARRGVCGEPSQFAPLEVPIEHGVRLAHPTPYWSGTTVPGTTVPLLPGYVTSSCARTTLWSGWCRSVTCSPFCSASRTAPDTADCRGRGQMARGAGDLRPWNA